MPEPTVAHSAAGDYPAVRGELVVEVAIVVTIPTCPRCGTAHRFVLADAAWAGKHRHLWLVTCPLAEPTQQFVVWVIPQHGRVALNQGEEIAAETQLGKTWDLGVTWAPDSVRTEMGTSIHDTAQLIERSMGEDPNRD